MEYTTTGYHGFNQDLANLKPLLEMFKNHAIDRSMSGDCIEYEPTWVDGKRCYQDRVTGEWVGFATTEQPPKGSVRFFGNFLTWSWVFNITTNDPKVIRKLRNAIKANKKRSDFLDQPQRESATFRTIFPDGREVVYEREV